MDPLALSVDLIRDLADRLGQRWFVPRRVFHAAVDSLEALLSRNRRRARTLHLLRSCMPQPVTSTLDLEVNRAFGDYVACNAAFRLELGRLRSAVAEYVAHGSDKKPLNILLAAPPGSGKSFLVNELATEFPASAFMEYYIPSLRSREDVTDILRVISSARMLRMAPVVPFVLLDEIDGMVSGQRVFDDLLAPMWEGRYFDGRRKEPLGKSVFFFAGSGLLQPPTLDVVLGPASAGVPYHQFATRWVEKAREGLKKTSIEKLPDFVDRMDLLVCIPPLHPLISDTPVATEVAILIWFMIEKYHGRLERVEKSAAWALMRLLAESPSRRAAESAAFMSQTPADGCFRFAHLPEKTRDEHSTDPLVQTLHNTYYERQPRAAGVAPS